MKKSADKLTQEREKEIKALISSMTLEEKVSQMLHTSPSVDRLGIPEYNWWSECLHGVARAGAATVFPEPIGLAATFDPKLAQKEADAISDEARAKYNEALKAGVRTQYRGLTFWTPNVNIFRDPRWGRGQETYGEDPHLTGVMGSAIVKGLQGNDPDHMKVAACAKHFAVHSGPESQRHTFNAVVSKKDLWETYLPAFKALVDAGVESVMGAYNRTLGEPCCGSKLLLQDILRKKWGFKGHVVSDCWAVRDFHENHKVTKSPAESAALAINNGCDLNCGCTFPAAVEAVKTGLLDESKIDEALYRLFETRAKLGMFDAKKDDPYRSLGAADVDTTAHRILAKKAAAESIVLLKNSSNLLPLSSKPKHVLVIGPTAANIQVLLGNYYGLNPHLVTILEGMTQKAAEMPGITLDYTLGCSMYAPNTNNGWTVGMAEGADVVIACFGLDNAMEGEEGESVASESKGDREHIELPQWQHDYLKALHERGTPVVLVLTGGSPIAFNPDFADAVLFAWYPGEEGGNAVADVIFGKTVPSGHLPVTFPKSTGDLPPYEDYAMKGRTYRYMEKEPLFPFGFGLSYTTFAFKGLQISEKKMAADTKLKVSIDVKNTGKFDGDEVVQLYVAKKNRSADDPACTLRAFSRVHVKRGETAHVSLKLDSHAFDSVNSEGESVLVPGTYVVTVADAAPLPCSEKLGAAAPVTAEIVVN
ncbi:MAG TPA: glycosyl hydrolase [Treponema sp.]|nr:glycosyl hydrolase [Treponema sp.]